jgi:hypothetical protein
MKHYGIHTVQRPEKFENLYSFDVYINIRIRCRKVQYSCRKHKDKKKGKENNNK